MTDRIRFSGAGVELEVDAFLALVERVWPGDFDRVLTQRALRRTQNFTAWHEDRLVGCARLLTDGYYFSTLTEILVEPTYQRRGIGSRLMEMVWDASPTSVAFGVQTESEGFFEKLGYSRSLAFYQKLKPRPTPAQ